MEENEVTQKLKRFLAETGRPKTWAAREINVSYPHFHAVLNGKRNLSDSLRVRILNLLCKMATPIAS